MARSSLSSVLPVSFSWSLDTVPESDQRLCLIHSESSRKDRELCDYWMLTSVSLIQQYGAVTQWVAYVLCLITWDPVIQAFIDHEEYYYCIFYEREEILWSKVSPVQRKLIARKVWCVTIWRHTLLFAKAMLVCCKLRGIFPLLPNLRQNHKNMWLL